MADKPATPAPAGEVRFRPHPPQDPVLSCDSRFVATVTGKRGGKSVIGSVWLLQEIKRLYDLGKRGHFLICAPTVKILEQATLPTFREYFMRMGWGAGKNGGWQEAKSRFELKWKTPGGEPCYIYVRSTDEPEHLEGMTVLAAWADETGQMKDGTWDNIQARLSFDRGRAILTSTPYAPNWFWRDVMAKAGFVYRWNGAKAAYEAERSEAEDRDDAVSLFRWKTVDNPHFSKEEYERLRKTMSPDKFSRDYEGEAKAMEGLVYSGVDEIIVKPFQIPPEWKRWAGMDFGQSDPTVVLCIAEKPEVQADPANKIDHQPSIFYVYREFYKKGALTAQYAEFLLSEPLDHIVHDPSAAQTVADLTRYFNVRRLIPADNDRESGVERIKGLIHAGRLRIFRGRCDNTIREMLAYHYKAPNFDRPQKDDPVGVNDHCMDALRYAFSRENMQGLYRGAVKRARRAASRAADWWGDSPSRQQAVDKFTGYPL